MSRGPSAKRQRRSDDDDDIADLLQRTGGRDEPPERMRAEIEAALRADWREVVRQHRKHRDDSIGIALNLD